MDRRWSKLIICFLFLFLNSNSAAWFSSVSSDGGVPIVTADVLIETFDSAGYDNTWNETLAGTPTNVIDEDSTAQYVSSPQSALIQIEDDTADGYSASSITEQTSTTYFQAAIWVDGSSFGADWTNVFAINMLDGATSAVRIYVQHENDSQVKFLINNEAGSDDFGNQTEDAWHTISVKYNSDGSLMTTWKIDGGAETNVVNESNNRDIDTVRIGSTAAEAATTGDIYIDDVKVCSESTKSACGY